MVSATRIAAFKTLPGKAMAADAMADLCAFVGVTQTNLQALHVWDEYIAQARPVIEVAVASDGHPQFFLSKPLAAFVTTGVQHVSN